MGTFLVSGTAPNSPEDGDIWFNSIEGKLLIYFDNFWIETVVGEIGPTGPTGPSGSLTEYIPSTPSDWNSTPNTISDALDEIASRLRSLEP
jgi:hypothetical protein